DAREMVVGSIATLPHRQHQGFVGLLRVLEAAGELLQARKGMVGFGVGRAVLELDLAGLARRLAAFERYVDQLGNGCARGNVRKTAVAQDRGFERELRRETKAHLRLG